MEQIAQEIRSGRLPPGAKLPTEHELMEALGVSRTVVREAVAALRAEGLVVSRQGAGVFVADESRAAFRISADGLSSIEEVLQVMELRLASKSRPLHWRPSERRRGRRKQSNRL